MESKRVLILANKYPNDYDKTTNMFIQQLASEFSDLGLETMVVCPMPVNINIKNFKLPYLSLEKTENNNDIHVFRPKYISLGQSGSLLKKFRVKITTFLYQISVNKLIKKLKKNQKTPDFLYAYFICPTGVVASRLGKKYHIPAFMEHGEALYSGDKKYGNKKLKKELINLSGVIAVSNQNKQYLLNAGVVDECKIVVYPNCYREERFYKIDKIAARKHFNFDESQFIVGYVGSLDERKGFNRLSDSVDSLENVYFAVAGKGPLTTSSSKCLWAKPILHSELVYFFNSLDAFVLPTLAEGSCTAIAEAIGCGCPIISSSRPFNENLCNKDNSILVDPNNIEEISNAINKLYCDRDLLDRMSLASIEKAKELKQKDRMKKVLNFMIEMSELNEKK